MKKLINTAFFYLFYGIASGLFYREFTKYFGYTGKTDLLSIHFHVITLGFFMFLIIALFNSKYNLEEHKNFKKFYIIYNIGLICMTLVQIVGGVVEVKGMELSRGLSASIMGISGVSHILLTIGIVILYFIFKNNVIKKTNQ